MADYRVIEVGRDGVPVDLSSHGPNLSAALHEAEELRAKHGGPSPSFLYFVYDADDPERGYMGWEDLPPLTRP